MTRPSFITKSKKNHCVPHLPVPACVDATRTAQPTQCVVVETSSLLFCIFVSVLSVRSGFYKHKKKFFFCFQPLPVSCFLSHLDPDNGEMVVCVCVCVGEPYCETGSINDRSLMWEESIPGAPVNVATMAINEEGIRVLGQSIDHHHHHHQKFPFLFLLGRSF